MPHFGQRSGFAERTSGSIGHTNRIGLSSCARRQLPLNSVAMALRRFTSEVDRARRRSPCSRRRLGSPAR